MLIPGLSWGPWATSELAATRMIGGLTLSPGDNVVGDFEVVRTFVIRAYLLLDHCTFLLNTSSPLPI